MKRKVLTLASIVILVIMLSGAILPGSVQAGDSFSTGIPSDSSALNQGNSDTTGSIIGLVFDDINENQEKEPEENVLSDVTVNLNKDGLSINSTLTSDDGTYMFSEVPVGSYAVIEIDPPGYESTTSNSISIVVTAGETGTVNFGDIILESISTPSAPTGPDNTPLGELLVFNTGGAVSNRGDNVEYCFDWDNDSYSEWSEDTYASVVIS